MMKNAERRRVNDELNRVDSGGSSCRCGNMRQPQAGMSVPPMRVRSLPSIAFFVTLFIAGACFAQANRRITPQMAQQPNIVRGDEINDAQRAAVERGLKRLASKQLPDGTYGSAGDQ